MKTKVVNVLREKGIERDSNYVYIGRGSIYGNPFSHLTKRTGALVQVETREESIEKYKEWIDGEIELDIDPPTKEEIMKLENRILGCFCHPKKCHGNVLVKIIEEEKSKINKKPKSKNIF